MTRETFPDFHYLSLEDPQTREEAKEDPKGFLRRLEGRGGSILDEVQRAPALFSCLQGIVDQKRGGPFLLTGSQQFLLHAGISQSLAGRTAVLELLGFSLAELRRRPARSPESIFGEPDPDGPPPPWELNEILFRGMFPPIHDRDLEARTWLDGYARTYLERDVRLAAGVGDLDGFTRFVGLCAGRVGQLLNAASLGADAGVSQPTARKWLTILQTGYILELLRPYHRNFGKRLIRSPRLYFLDTGLLCRLLAIRNAEDLRLHPLRGAIFENFVVTELWKLFLHHGERPPLHFWRDTHGHEVDLLVDLGSRLWPVEVKAGETVAGDFLRGLDRFAALSGEPGGVLVYGGRESYTRGPHRIRSWAECS